MTKHLMTATLFLLPVLSYSLNGAAQDGKQQRIAHIEEDNPALFHESSLLKTFGTVTGPKKTGTIQ